MGFYLFAVIPEAVNKTFKDVVLDGETCKVITVPYKDMSAVAAKAPIRIYEPSRKNAKAHQDAVSNIMKDHTVIPVSFGNIVESEKDVEIFMRQLYPNFKTIFPKIIGKFEVGLKLVGKKDWMASQAQNNPKLKQMQQSMQDKTKASSFYDRIAIGEASKDFVSAIHLQFEEEVFQPLSKIANAAKSNEVVNERMLLNAAFLLDKEQEEAFDVKVNEIYEKWKDKVDFTYTGPWPAYNFIDLKVKAGAR